MAPAKVLQGAVREQGKVSSPTPDTHVRVACACAAEVSTNIKVRKAKAWKVRRVLLILRVLLEVYGSSLGRGDAVGAVTGR
jgi:hypothetical protein